MSLLVYLGLLCQSANDWIAFDMTATQHAFFSGAERGMQQRRGFMENHEKDKLKKIESARSVAKHE